MLIIVNFTSPFIKSYCLLFHFIVAAVILLTATTLVSSAKLIVKDLSPGFISSSQNVKHRIPQGFILTNSLLLNDHFETTHACAQ